jgi:hypothetical protein
LKRGLPLKSGCDYNVSRLRARLIEFPKRVHFTARARAGTSMKSFVKDVFSRRRLLSGGCFSSTFAFIAVIDFKAG